ncbi:RNA polymerase subunit RPO18, partial [Monkeypox virus]
FVTNGYLPVT